MTMPLMVTASAVTGGIEVAEEMRLLVKQRAVETPSGHAPFDLSHRRNDDPVGNLARQMIRACCQAYSAWHEASVGRCDDGMALQSMVTSGFDCLNAVGSTLLTS